ncbi:MAG: prepilin peptidase [Alphaproteobacteria bacterium]|nr:prepilin peptidase [Alphaproteobacteria bacterium]MBV9418534.1 prepilin peptidase [Alphaproteobacteria bacterium]MBV9540046.1 prepilin peptidase [Alphaproteobacteria bacterium]MBV9904059.1 prepilin peptidase [Alphaproteobacteria bacterium]
MAAELLVLIVLPALLALAAGWDLASFTIPNFLQIALIGAFLVFVVATGMPAAAIGGHLLAAFLGLVVGFTLFAFGYIGGGDAKLFACVLLWFGFTNLVDYTVVASIMGGALTLAIIGLRHIPLPAFAIGQKWILRLHDAKSGIPYGVALAAGAFVILPQTEIFRIAATL